MVKIVILRAFDIKMLRVAFTHFCGPKNFIRTSTDDRGEVVVIIIFTTGDEDQGSSQSLPWLRKLSALHLPPLQLAATWIDGHLVVTALFSIFLISKQIWNWDLDGQTIKTYCLSISPKQGKLTSVVERVLKESSMKHLLSHAEIICVHSFTNI